MQEFNTLVQFGGIGLGAMALWMFWKLASNHINHNTQVLQQLVDVIRELKEYLRK